MAVKILRFIIGFFMAVFAIVIAALCAGMLAVPFFQSIVALEIAHEGSGLSMWQAILLIESVLLGMILLLATAQYFFLLLWRVLGSIEGDPFIPANSDRLSRMAWTALIGNAFALLFGVYVTWAQTFIADLDEANEVTVDFGGGGLVLILVLFVLARVFREGTKMREDLEGTV